MTRSALSAIAGAAIASSLLAATATAGASVGLSTQGDRTDAAGPLDLTKVALEQDGRRLSFRIRTSFDWRLGQLKRTPRLRRRPAFLCLETRQAGEARRSCLGTSRDRAPRLASGRIRDSGEVGRFRDLAARISRGGPRAVEVTLALSQLGLHGGLLRWRARSGWDAGPCAPGAAGAEPCLDALPDRRYGAARVRRPVRIGCRRAGRRVNFSGATHPKMVALTFDDGPGPYTARILRALDRQRAEATFFVLGGQVSPYASLLRRMIRNGHEIGNHTYSHRTSGSPADLAATSRRVRRASGFQPCVFRPVGGWLGGDAISSAWRLGMSTILWDVDPWDWATPGAGAIYQRVVQAVRPGSIVVMHDGGGSRAQTVAAVPAIVSNLKSRGFRLVTVTRILEQRYRWGP